jgi:hypothetical protein
VIRSLCHYDMTTELYVGTLNMAEPLNHCGFMSHQGLDSENVR